MKELVITFCHKFHGLNKHHTLLFNVTQVSECGFIDTGPIGTWNKVFIFSIVQ